MSAANPIPRVTEWLKHAQQADPSGYNAMSLATVGPDGKPSARIVLLKSFDEQGFVFYTNYQSRKGRELLGFPHAALVFHWPGLKLQLRAEGPVAPVSPAEADAYFASRPRGSQIGAWASSQSETLNAREELLQRVADLERRFEGKPVPRPPHWSGFRLTPMRIEFWTDEPSRLHRREAFERVGDEWTMHLLNP